MDIRAVIWDLGGVLVRTEDHTPRRRLAEKLQIPFSELVQIFFDSDSSRRAQLGEIGIDEHWDYIREYFGLEVGEMDGFKRQFWEGDVVDYDLIDQIHSLRNSSYKTGLLSNAYSNIHEFIESDKKIADAFDTIVVSSEEGIMKPDPRLYHLILERMGINAENAVFFDDSLENVLGARQVGMHAVQFINSGQVREDLRMLLEEERNV